MIEQQDVQNFRTEMLAIQSLCEAGSVTVRCKSCTDLYATLTRRHCRIETQDNFFPSLLQKLCCIASSMLVSALSTSDTSQKSPSEERLVAKVSSSSWWFLKVSSISTCFVHGILHFTVFSSALLWLKTPLIGQKRLCDDGSTFLPGLSQTDVQFCDSGVVVQHLLESFDSILHTHTQKGRKTITK